jgi:hypothetical protein
MTDADILELWTGDPTHSRPVLGKNKVLAFARALLAAHSVPMAEGAKQSHSWDEEGDHCTKCGDPAWCADKFCAPKVAAAAPALAPETNPHHEAEFEADAKRLALELECIMLDCKDTAISAKWWDSGMEALEQHRKLLADTAELAPFPSEQQPDWIRNALPPETAPAPAEQHRAPFLPCPICNGVEGCDHTVPERRREVAFSNDVRQVLLDLTNAYGILEDGPDDSDKAHAEHLLAKAIKGARTILANDAEQHRALSALRFKEALHDHFNEYPIPTQLGVVAIMKHIEKVYAILLANGGRESAVERGLFATPEEYDAMVDDSLRKKGTEVLTGRGNNYGKKVAKDGSLYRPPAQRSPECGVTLDTSLEERLADAEADVARLHKEKMDLWMQLHGYASPECGSGEADERGAEYEALRASFNAWWHPTESNRCMSSAWAAFQEGFARASSPAQPAQDERGAFEAHLRSIKYPLLPIWHNGVPSDHVLRDMFAGWQARASSPAPSGEARDALLQLREGILSIPRRYEPIGGQTYSYVKLEEVLVWIGTEIERIDRGSEK